MYRFNKIKIADPTHNHHKQDQEEEEEENGSVYQDSNDHPNQRRVDLRLVAPIVSSDNDRVRPLLDAVDKLRNLMVMEEGIQLPTIVVVGDQSSGKSSVLESLARIKLPRGQGICTRVPLIMRLQNHSDPDADLVLEYNNKRVRTDECHVSGAINAATEVIAGNEKGISKTPLTLTVKKRGVPDLTMVDLPGITRVPVHGQPEDIEEQVRDIIMEYIKPEASIILNVLSATVDFSTCGSIRMSQSVDRTGERTLAVVTKSDKSPEELLDKVTSDDISIGLGYVCVRNRVGDESYEEARAEEARLFSSHPLLSKIDKSIVGIPVLAEKLMQIQAKSIDKSLPDIDKKIHDKLSKSLLEFNTLPKPISSVAEALRTFTRLNGLVKESLRKILLQGDFTEYPDKKKMHCTARLADMLAAFSNELHSCPESEPAHDFLIQEIDYLEESKDIALPNFLPRTAFLSILQSKVTGIASIPIGFVDKVWDYVEEVVLAVTASHVEDYHQLKISARRAALCVVEKMRERAMKWVMELVEMEKHTDFTSNPAFVSDYDELIAKKGAFMEAVSDLRQLRVYLEGFGWIELEKVRQFSGVIEQAFDLRMRIVAYWKVVLRRMVDFMALNLRLSLHNFVDKELEREVMGEMMGPTGDGVERLMEESPSVAIKRTRLAATVKKLKECKEVLAKIRGRICD